MKISRATCLLRVAVLLSLLIVLGSLVIPSSGGLDHSRNAKAKNDVTQIATAAIAFEVEYGRPPRRTSGAVEGELLSALMGSNSALNPREIVFLEVAEAKNGKSGISHGSFIDPWGGVYQIAFCSDAGGPIRAGTNGIVLKRDVAVWNDPRLGKKVGRWFSAEKPVPYITSWE